MLIGGEVGGEDWVLVDIVSTYFVSHPAFVTMVADSLFVILVTWHIYFIRTASWADYSIGKVNHD